VSTLALAVSAALVLAVGDTIGSTSAGAEAAFVPLWLLGWTLLVWAVLVGGLSALHICRRLTSSRPTGWSDVVVLVAGACVIAVAVHGHPLWGSGAGQG